jgi:pre-mRNA-splicing factor CWC22
MAHRLESFKLRNIAKFFAHLLATNTISWKVCNFSSSQDALFTFSFQILQCIHLTESQTTSLSRFFLKNLFFELFQYNGLTRLNRHLNDP